MHKIPHDTDTRTQQRNLGCCMCNALYTQTAIFGPSVVYATYWLKGGCSLRAASRVLAMCIDLICVLRFITHMRDANVCYKMVRFFVINPSADDTYKAFSSGSIVFPLRFGRVNWVFVFVIVAHITRAKRRAGSFRVLFFFYHNSFDGQRLDRFQTQT